MRRIVVGVAVGFLLAYSSFTQQTVSADEVSSQLQSFAWKMTFEREGLPVPEWTIARGMDGKTTFHARRADGVAVPETSFVMSVGTSTRLSSLLVASKGMTPCESRAKNLANMGRKTMEFSLALTSAALATCSFNYSENKPLLVIADLGQAIAYTQQAGTELARLHRFDRLGLDREMILLDTAVAEGNAIELQSIAETLHSIATDPLVLERVRSKALSLLERATR